MRFRADRARHRRRPRQSARATAEIIGREGGTVVLVDTDKARSTRRPAPSARARRRRRTRLAADALAAAQVESVVRRTVQEHKRIDILANAVGGSNDHLGKRRPADRRADAGPTGSSSCSDLNRDVSLLAHAVVPVHERHARGQDRPTSRRIARARPQRPAAAPPTPAKGGNHRASAPQAVARAGSATQSNAQTRSAPSLSPEPAGCGPRWDGNVADRAEGRGRAVPLAAHRPSQSTRARVNPASSPPSDADFVTGRDHRSERAASSARRARKGAFMFHADSQVQTCWGAERRSARGPAGPAGSRRRSRIPSPATCCCSVELARSAAS